MAKSNKEKNVEAQAIDIAGLTPDEVKAVPVPARITTQDEAEALIKQEYSIPANVPFVLVTEDRNVFYATNASSGVNHAIRNNLKSFRVTCQV